MICSGVSRALATLSSLRCAKCTSSTYGTGARTAGPSGLVGAQRLGRERGMQRGYACVRMAVKKFPPFLERGKEVFCCVQEDRTFRQFVLSSPLFQLCPFVQEIIGCSKRPPIKENLTAPIFTSFLPHVCLFTS